VTVVPTFNPHWIPLSCTDCTRKPAVKEQLAATGFTIVHHAGGMVCRDFESETAAANSNRNPKFNSAAWKDARTVGCKNQELITVEGSAPFAAFDGGMQYDAVGPINDWNGNPTYTITVMVKMPWWDKNDKYNASQLELPLVSGGVVFRTKINGEWVSLVDLNPMGYAEYPGACSLWPSRAFEKSDASGLSIQRVRGMTASDIVSKFYLQKDQLKDIWNLDTQAGRDSMWKWILNTYMSTKFNGYAHLSK
jgi:hypothetical protein